MVGCPIHHLKITSHGHSYFTWGIFTLCGHSHSPAHKITFKGMVGCPLNHLKSHLAWAFSPHVGQFHLMWTLSFCVDIPTLHEHFYLMCTFSPHMGIFTLHGHSNLVYMLPCSSHCENNIFDLVWKKITNKSRSNPKSTNKVLLRATNNELSFQNI